MTTHRVAVHNLDGSERIHSLPIGNFTYKHVLNGAGTFEGDVSMASVARADIEPGASDYRIYEDEVLRAAGRIWLARVDAGYNRRTVHLIGNGLWSVIGERRMVPGEVRYEPDEEDPPNLNTSYGLSQEEILFDLISRSQAEPGGDLGIVAGTHTGASVTRRRWYCEEDGTKIADVATEFTELSDGIDWAITPTLSDTSLGELTTWNPSRGADLSGSVALDPTEFLDTLTYEIDAGNITTRAHTVGNADCDRPIGDETNSGALATYGLLEDWESVDSEEQTDVTEHATEMLNSSASALQAFDVFYLLADGPALGSFDIGDLVHVTSPRDGWEMDEVLRVNEIEVTVQMPQTPFVRVNVGVHEDLGS